MALGLLGDYDMAKVTLMINSFNCGEVSPLMLGRNDVEKYKNSCQVLENFIPTIQGPVSRRSGSMFIANTNNNAQVILVPFKSSIQKSYMLEFGAGYMRVYSDGGQVVNPNGSPYQIATPFALTDLFQANGEWNISIAQSLDVMYICTAGWPPQKLTSNDDNIWYLTPVNFQNGPFADTNTSQNLQIQGIYGVPLAASYGLYAWDYTNPASPVRTDAPFFGYPTYDSVFLPPSLPFYLEMSPNTNVVYWVANSGGTGSQTAAYTKDQIVRNAGNNYQCALGGISGFVAPVVTVGFQNDGNPGCRWQYLDSSYQSLAGSAGIVNGNTEFIVINGPISPVFITGTDVLSSLWAQFAWLPISGSGYPTDVCFFRNRLVFARGQTLWFSCVGDYENFASTEFGEITDNSAITIDVQNGDSNEIAYLYPLTKGLIVGTSAGQTLISEASIQEPFSPTNVKASNASGIGASSVPPIRVASSNIFVQRGGKFLRDLQYDFDNDQFNPVNVSLYNELITGSGITQTAFVEIPQQIIWCMTADGNLIGLTFEKNEAVMGWHRHYLGGGGFVESIAAIPSDDGSYDQLYLSVRRVINGATVRFIEYLQEPFNFIQSINSAFMVDAGLTATFLSPATVISGLNYLEECTVVGLADGYPIAPQVVTNGSITLATPATTVIIGLPYYSRLETVPADGGSQMGASMGKIRRINKVIIKLLDSMGGSIGTDFNKLQPINYRTTNNAMDQPIPQFSGDLAINIGDGYSLDQTLCILQDQPLPFTLLSAVLEITVYDRN